MFVVEAIAINPITNKPYNPCGSDYTAILQDLKTVRGVKNRIKNWQWRKNVIELHIVRYYDWKNSDSLSPARPVEIIREFKRMSF